jgi:hypothetical protein
MRWKMLLWGACVLLLAPVAYSGPSGIDPGTPDTVRIDSVTVFNIEPGIVPIYFYNDENLAGIEVTVSFDSPDVTVDSFSFVGGRVEYVSLKGLLVGTGTITIYCFPFDTDPLIAPGNGLLGQIHFSYPDTIAAQVVTIDTLTIAINNRVYATAFSDNTANAFSPQFRKGSLVIEQYTSCCIGSRGNVDNDPNDDVNVADLTYLVNFLFQGGPPPVCIPEANIDADPSDQVNVADLTYLVNFLFQGGLPPPLCTLK